MSDKKDDPDHDGSYRTLFAQPALVQQLLETFAPPELVPKLHFDQMEPLPTAFLSKALARRNPDCIWKIPMVGGDPLYLCLLLEFHTKLQPKGLFWRREQVDGLGLGRSEAGAPHRRAQTVVQGAAWAASKASLSAVTWYQSTVDAFMAVRVATYIGLLYEHLIDTDRKALSMTLPPVLPIVLYNGEKAWDAFEELASFYSIDPGLNLMPYQLQCRHLILDIGRLTLPPEAPNLVSTIFEMEQATHQDRVEGLGGFFDVLLTLTDDHPAKVALRRAFLIFFEGVLRHRGALMSNDTVHDLAEVRTMLHSFEELIERRAQQLSAQALAEARAEAREAMRRLVLNQMVAKLGVDLETWRTRLASLDEEGLSDLSLRIIAVDSEQELNI